METTIANYYTNLFWIISVLYEMHASGTRAQHYWSNRWRKAQMWVNESKEEEEEEEAMEMAGTEAKRADFLFHMGKMHLCENK